MAGINGCQPPGGDDIDRLSVPRRHHEWCCHAMREQLAWLTKALEIEGSPVEGAETGP